MRRTSLTCLVMVIGIISACGGYSVDLPNGYRLVQTSASRNVVADPSSSVIIDATVVEYAVVGTLVLGRAEVPEVLPGARQVPRRQWPSYFYVDTEAGEVADGLSRSQWLDALRGRGIEEPNLVRPTALHAIGICW